MFRINTFAKITMGLLFSLIGFFASAKVFEIQTMKQALPLIDQNTLVVFDIDNTIQQPRQMLGSDQWGMNQIARFKAQGLDERTAKDNGVAQFAQVQMKTLVQPVERMTPALIRYLQKNKVKVLALTARPLTLANRSVEQLSSIGIDLTLTAPSAALKQRLGTEPTLYNKGILLVGPHNNKGTVLAQFIKSNIQQPISKVVFIDDKVGNVQNVDEGLKGFSFPHFELRYSAADAYVKSFNSKIGDLQWYVFQKNKIILSDSEAAKILNGQR